MVICSKCKYDLDSKQFTKNQIKKGLKYRKCKDCTKKAMNKKKYAVNTTNVIHKYYEKIISESCNIFTINIVNIIVSCICNGKTLHGIYEDSQQREDSKRKEFNAFSKYDIINGTGLILNKNLTFKWTMYENVALVSLSRSMFLSGYDDDNIYKRTLFETKQLIIEGLYKCINNETLKFEGYDNINGKIINFTATIIYLGNSIKINSEIPLSSSPKLFILLPKIKEKDSIIFNM